MIGTRSRQHNPRPSPDTAMPDDGHGSSSDCPPVPWSSSPIEHLRPPLKVAPEKRATSPVATVPQRKRARRTSVTDLPESRPLQPRQHHSMTEEQNKERQPQKHEGKPSLTGCSTGLATNAHEHLMAQVLLSDEQKAILQVVMEEKENVFFTGAAGTGKSMLTRAIVRGLQHRYRHRPNACAVTAPTGKAATILDGQTLHSFAGISRGDGTAQELVNKVKRDRK